MGQRQQGGGVVLIGVFEIGGDNKTDFKVEKLGHVLNSVGLECSLKGTHAKTVMSLHVSL